MARIIESNNSGRRIIKLTTDDVISVVSEYQRIVTRGADYIETRNSLENRAIFIPEDV